MLTADWEELATELGELRARRDRLAAGMAQALDRLRGQGMAPAAELLHSLRGYHSDHHQLQRRLIPTSESSAAIRCPSLEDLELAVRNGKRERQLTAFFDDIARLEFRGADSPGPLRGLHDDADQLRSRIDDGDGALADDLLEGRHALAAVLTLVCLRDELTDDVWIELQDRAAGHYGRELAAAVARGRITLRESCAPEKAEVST